MTRRDPLGRSRERGLSLIEVIVALVVISGYGAALFVWAGQTLQTATKAASVQQDAEIERNITELAYSVNPSHAPGGELSTQTHRYRWQATAERGPANQLRQPAGLGMYEVTLYRLRFFVTDPKGTQAPLISERIVAGYKQVRERQGGPPGFGDAGPSP
jgi:prepilin-type N-terminal cleavage/methylation domain-containing protein